MWKINVVMGEVRLTYTVSSFNTRDGRVLFIDKVTGNPCNYPERFCFIEGIK